jgi:hypothetical protein
VGLHERGTREPSVGLELDRGLLADPRLDADDPAARQGDVHAVVAPVHACPAHDQVDGEGLAHRANLDATSAFAQPHAYRAAL